MVGIHDDFKTITRQNMFIIDLLMRSLCALLVCVALCETDIALCAQRISRYYLQFKVFNILSTRTFAATGNSKPIAN